MKHQNRIKLKYKLLFAVFLPIMLLSLFVVRTLWRDYQEVLEMKNTLQINQFILDSSKVLGSLQSEVNQSLIYGDKLEEDRKISDEQLQDLFTKYQNWTSIERFQKPMDMLKEIRSLTDQKKVTADDLLKFLSAFEDEIFRLDSAFQHGISDPVINGHLLAYYRLLKMQNSARKEKWLLYDAFKAQELSHESYNYLVGLIARQTQLAEIYYELGDKDEDDILRTAFTSPFVSQVQNVEQSLLRNDLKEALKQDPENWWTIQTAKIDLIKNAESKLLTANIKYAQEKIHRLYYELFFTLSFFLLSMFGGAYLLFKSLKYLTDSLQEEINSLSTSGQEISASIANTTSNTTETATAVNETTTTMEELKQTAQVAAEKAKHVADVSVEAQNNLEQSQHTLIENLEGMNKIESGMETISKSILKLSENSNAIGKIIDTVNDIAEQSHILAVNAAIEAAKAGEQGKGFSVVAQEVRSLAEQSRQATVQVKEILNDIQNSTNTAVMAAENGSKSVKKGVDLTNSTAEAMHQLSENIDKVNQAASQIAITSQQQLIGVAQVTMAMNNIKDSSNQQVDNMHQIEKGIKGMNDVSMSLKHLVEEYKL